ncbi:MAG TPA: hypothetical protein VFQ80_03805, partial [Thermomicrobiales bacterium]|nr:hypothetical protein [Thermomicrobiales bacterium]
GAIGADVRHIIAAAGANNAQAFDVVRQGGFITFLWFVLTLISAAIGGLIGFYGRVDFLRRRGAVR